MRRFLTALALIVLASSPVVADLASDRAACEARDEQTNWKQIIVLCNKVLHSPDLTDDDLAAAMRARGRAHSMLREYDPAIADFDRAIDFDPEDFRPYANRALVYLELGNPARAIVDFNKAIALKPDNASLYEGRGRAYAILAELDTTKSDHDQARADMRNAWSDIEEAISVDPKYAPAHHARGLIRLFMDDSDIGAMADFDQAIALKPDYAEALTSRGLLRYQTGDLSGAGADIEMAIVIAPNYWRAYFFRAVMESKKGDAGAAAEDCSKAIALDPKGNIVHTYDYKAEHYVCGQS